MIVPSDLSISAAAPLVTLLTPTLNRQEMLVDTLASVHLQDYPNIEHIVVDGGSTDGTVDLLRRAEALWGVRWISQADEGMYEALNRGLRIARGEVVGWINSDDWLLPWAVSTVVSEMAKRPEPHAVFGDYLAISPNDPTARIRVYGQFNRRGLSTVETLAQPTVFWPASFTTVAGCLDAATYRQIADCEYWLRLSARWPFVKAREFIALGQDHPETKRASLAPQIEEEFRVLRQQYAPVRRWPAAERIASSLRWRREWAALLAGRGWSRSRASVEVAFPWEHDGFIAGILKYGPHRRRAQQRARASVYGFMESLSAIRRELDTDNELAAEAR